MRRRELLEGLALGAGGLSVTGLAGTSTASPAREGDRGDWRGLRVGVATYSLRELSLEDAIAAIRRVDLAYASIKSFHLPLESDPEQRQGVAAQFQAAGIAPLSCGNITLKNDPADVRRAFEYARDAGIPTIVCAPDPGALPLLDGMVKQFDLRIAIHNHGPEDEHFPSPYAVWDAVGSYDERIGLCIDVGHTARAGVDPAESIRRCRGRLYDLHLKDLDTTAPEGRSVEMGRGVLDVGAILEALLEVGYPHLVSFEYEKDPEDPLPGLAESVGYVKGVLRGIA